MGALYTTTQSAQRLLDAAQQWRDYGAGCSLQSQRDLAESTARNLERQAETGVATCVCCNKPFGQGTFALAKVSAS